MQLDRKIKILDGLPDKVYQQTISTIKWKDYQPDVEIIVYKEVSSDIYFLGKGHARATMYSRSGREVSYQDLYGGDVFGELSAIDELPRSAHVVTVEPSSIGALPRREFMKLFHAYHQVSDAVLLRLVSIIRDLSDRVYQYGALDVKDRVRKEILHLALQNMTGPNSAVIEPMPKHVEIANRVNTHREAVTRELNTLSKMGLIHQEKRVLTIDDIEKLSELLPEY